jgi:hypothetical protein
VSLEIFEDPVWQMSRGERAAVEGVLSQLGPSLAIEIGSMEGAALQRIAAHAGEVHSFDLSPPSLPLPANVTVHTGDSHELLAPFLAELEAQGRNVDFVIVDGDHSPDGVRRDIEDLLNSRAVARSVILIHDTANEGVRSGIDAVRFAAWPKVVHVELDWIPGQLFAEPALRDELWYGLGLVLVDAGRTSYLSESVYERRYHQAGPLLAQLRQLVKAREREPAADGEPLELSALRDRVRALERELAESYRRVARTAQLEQELGAARARIERADRVVTDLQSSASWRLTAPLRRAKRVGRRSAAADGN